MSILVASNLNKFFADEEVFSEINVEIPHGARIALVGPNGAGKTTLIKILIGLESPSGGTVTHSRGLRLGFLPQRPELLGDRTVWEEMMTAFATLHAREAEIHTLADQMADMSRPDHEAILERYGKLQEQFELEGGYEYEARIKQVLTGLGFAPEDYHKPIPILSGGQKTRAFLARLLLQAPDLLVLDEPTNHLDINAVEWLESFLNSWRGAVLVVSHDRYFMDNVVTHIWEMDWNRIETYRGNYSHYVTQREERHERRFVEYEAQQEYIAKEEEYIRRHIAGQNTRIAKGKLKRLDRLKRDKLVTRPRTSRAMNISLQASMRSGDKVLMTNRLNVGYSDSPRALFTVPDITLYRGETAAIIGPNGVGKSTLLKTLLRQMPSLAGESRLGAAVQIGYFAQAHELLTDSNTILDELMRVKEMNYNTARDYLAKFLFTGDDVYRTIGTLSGGERGRVALAKLALSGANFLLLDEPTNHLDIPAQEVLQAVLSEFEGTILLVSHDRYLINALATQIWAAAPGQLEVFEGTYQEYLTHREAARQARALAKEAAKEQAKADPKNGTSAVKANGLTSKPLAKSKAQKDHEKHVIAVEAAIQALETKLSTLTTELSAAGAAGKLDKVRDLGLAYAATQAELDQKMADWETLLAT